MLAVLSGNDYSENKKGYGIGRNLELLQQASDDDPEQLLFWYCKKVNAEEIQYNNAKKIFFDHSETIIENVTTSPDRRQAVIELHSHLVEKYQRNKRDGTVISVISFFYDV